MRKLALWCLSLAPAFGDVRLPALISDHMVLQQGGPARIWGKADPGETVTVAFEGQSVSTTADTMGAWAVFLRPLKARDAGSDLTVAGKNSITVHDVLVGEVWVGSGQSNMEWRLGSVINAEQEVAGANYPAVRLFEVKHTVAETPADDVTGSWVVCEPEAAKKTSAVGYFFSRHLHQQLKVPVGFIHSSWGGTPAEAWTSGPALAADPGLSFVFDTWQKALANYPAARARYDRDLAEFNRAKAEGRTARQPGQPMGPGHSWTPAGLYNAMIAPLTPYAIRGAIWYQGESNAGAGPTKSIAYRRLFRDMIEDWRRAWGQGTLPFLFVQLANFQSNGEWPVLRESQSDALNLRDTGMAVTIDIGESKDIHPKNKQEVGRRLALAARSIVYGEKLEYSGPVFRGVAVEGPRLRLYFDHTGKGLDARGGPLQGFWVAGADRRWMQAEASIDGDTIVVSSAQVPDPVAVRYAWSDDPVEANLINKDGLPASPFRSDRWEQAGDLKPR